MRKSPFCCPLLRWRSPTSLAFVSTGPWANMVTERSKNGRLHWAKVKSASRFSCFQVSHFWRLNESRCIMIIYILLSGPSKSIDSRESGERRNQSPSLGCPPSQTIVTTRNFTFWQQKLNLHLPLVLERETSQSQVLHHPIPLPPTLRATEVLDWLFICAAAGAIGGQRCLFSAAETTTTTDHQSPFKKNK